MNQSDQPEGNLEDPFISKAVRKAYDDISIPPDHEEAWLQMKARLSSERSKLHSRRNSRIWLTAASVVVCLCFASLMSDQINPLQSFNAMVKSTQQMTGSFSSEKESFADAKSEAGYPSHLALDDTEPASVAVEPQRGNILLNSEKEVLWESVAAQFPGLDKPRYLPAGYKYENVKATSEGNHYVSVHMEFSDAKSQDLINIYYELIPDGRIQPEKTVETEGAVVTQISIHEAQAVMATVPGKYVNLMWTTETAKWQMTTFLSEEEAIKVARSLPSE